MNALEVDIHIPCTVDQFFPETGFNLVKVLEKAGAKVYYNEEQTCCGHFAFQEGFWEEAKTLGEKFIKEYNPGRMMVSTSASCLGYIKSQFDELFYNGAYHNEYRQMQRNVFEIADYLVNVLKKTQIGAKFPHRVLFMPSCQGVYQYGLKDEALKLLRNVDGLTLAEVPELDECMDFGAIFSQRHKALSEVMCGEVTSAAMASGAEVVVSNDIGAVLQWKLYISKQKLPLRSMHLVDVLASGY